MTTITIDLASAFGGFTLGFFCAWVVSMRHTDRDDTTTYPLADAPLTYPTWTSDTTYHTPRVKRRAKTKSPTTEPTP